MRNIFILYFITYITYINILHVMHNGSYDVNCRIKKVTNQKNIKQKMLYNSL